MKNPPILSAPKACKKIYLYLVVSKTSTSIALVREEGGKQHPIFYTSQTMTDTKTRYSIIEKIGRASCRERV